MNKQFRPMLAGEADLSRLSFPLFASPKLDGVRALVKDGVVLSRSLKPIPNKFVQWRFGRPELEGFDGELIVGAPTAEDVYRATTSAVMRREGEPAVVLHAFDLHDQPDICYSSRLFMLKERHRQLLLEGDRSSAVLPLISERVSSLWALERFEEWALAEGFEGVILRSPDSLYKYGRSTAKEGTLLKLKRFKDSEARILAVEELMHNGNAPTTNELGRTKRSSHQENLVPAGTMGALLVEDVHTGQVFHIGTGFSQQDRDDFWKWRGDCIGTLVKYKFFPVGVKDLPRHPSYLGLRDPLDL